MSIRPITVDRKVWEGIKQVVNHGFTNRATKLIDIAGDLPDKLEPNFFQKIIRTFKHIGFDMWRNAASSIAEKLSSKATKLAEKFPENKVLPKISAKLSKANDWQPFINARTLKQKEQAARVLKGLYKKGGKGSIDILEQLNKSAGDEVGKYNTRDGEAMKRLITGVLPIPFLFSDSLYISKKNGVSDEDAKKLAWNKASQEGISAAGESLTQFAMLSMFTNFINSSQFGAPLINTSIGTFFHVVSRLKTGRKLSPLTKEEIRANEQKKLRGPVYKMEDFQKYVKKKEALDTNDPKKDEKKHWLTLKNILIFAAASIIAGFSLKLGKDKLINILAGKSNNAFGKKVARIADSIVEKYRRIVMEDVQPTKKVVGEFFDEMKNHTDVTENIRTKGLRNNFIGSRERFVTIGKLPIFNKIPLLKKIPLQLSVRKFIEIPLLPFKIAFEALSYPYKAVKNLLKLIPTSKLEKSNFSVIRGFSRSIKTLVCEPEMTETMQKLKGVGKINDPHNILNFYNQYEKMTQKFGDDSEKLTDEFGKFFKSTFDRTFDPRFSKNDNSKIGKLTQTMGLTGSIYFATNDDYNQTLSETGNTQKAQADQRKRGVQKFTRSVSNIVLSNWFNSVFLPFFNSSLLGTGLIVGASTLAVDKITRFILGQPSKKMTGDDLKAFEKKKQESLMAPFYKLLDKMAQ